MKIEMIFNATMTGLAQRNEVAKSIGSLPITVKSSIRSAMMNVKTYTTFAYLASMTISLQALLALCFPIWAAPFVLPAIYIKRIVWPLIVLIPTFVSTKSLAGMIAGGLKRLLTDRAYLWWIKFRHPLPMTFRRAKVMFLTLGFVLSSFKGSSTVRADQSNSTFHPFISASL